MFNAALDSRDEGEGRSLTLTSVPKGGADAPQATSDRSVRSTTRSAKLVRRTRSAVSLKPLGFTSRHKVPAASLSDSPNPLISWRKDNRVVLGCSVTATAGQLASRPLAPQCPPQSAGGLRQSGPGALARRGAFRRAAGQAPSVLRCRPPGAARLLNRPSTLSSSVLLPACSVMAAFGSETDLACTGN